MRKTRTKYNIWEKLKSFKRAGAYDHEDCAIGYNDFNILVVLDRWWLQDFILRLIYKKNFVHFSSCFVWILTLHLLCANIHYRYQNTAEFEADFESVKNCCKTFTRKKLKQKCDEILSFLLLFSFFIFDIFNNFEFGTKFCVLWYLFKFFPKNCWLHKSKFCLLWSQTCM